MNEMMTLLGCSSIIHNAWSINPVVALELISSIWKSLGSGQSLGASLYKSKQQLRPVYYYALQQYGLPYARIS